MESIHGCDLLTAREKEALRLLLVGHDAKSIARRLDRSVHTINERLRSARHKLKVSSSREAARLLHEREGGAPERLVHTGFGDAPPPPVSQDEAMPGVPAPSRRTIRAIGGSAMLVIVIALATVALPRAQAPSIAPTIAGAEKPVVASEAATAARIWLSLVDEGKWAESWAATGETFRTLNTVARWRAASQKARVPLGQLVSRTLVSEEDTPAPPHGYRTVRFRTDFTNKPGATEIVSLDREENAWKVVGVYVE